ncbi:Leucine-responsive regulatory protein [archaeon HR06]|nr:Leucine-responsive regulatory protein [archaeon HR06]
MKANLDELDRKILKELISNARQSFREIAKKLRISVGTVVARTTKMEREGIIKGYTALVDHEKIGYDLTAIIEIVVSKGKLIDMEKEVARFSSTCSVYDVTGLTDAIIIAKFKSREELSQFTKTLLSLPYVERTNTHVVLTTVKEDFRLDP